MSFVMSTDSSATRGKHQADENATKDRLLPQRAPVRKDIGVLADRRTALLLVSATVASALGAGAQVMAGFTEHVTAWQVLWLVAAVLTAAGGVWLTAEIKKTLRIQSG